MTPMRKFSTVLRSHRNERTGVATGNKDETSMCKDKERKRDRVVAVIRQMLKVPLKRGQIRTNNGNSNSVTKPNFSTCAKADSNKDATTSSLDTKSHGHDQRDSSSRELHSERDAYGLKIIGSSHSQPELRTNLAPINAQTQLYLDFSNFLNTTASHDLSTAAPEDTAASHTPKITEPLCDETKFRNRPRMRMLELNFFRKARDKELAGSKAIKSKKTPSYSSPEQEKQETDKHCDHNEGPGDIQQDTPSRNEPGTPQPHSQESCCGHCLLKLDQQLAAFESEKTGFEQHRLRLEQQMRDLEVKLYDLEFQHFLMQQELEDERQAREEAEELAELGPEMNQMVKNLLDANDMAGETLGGAGCSGLIEYWEGVARSGRTSVSGM